MNAKFVIAIATLAAAVSGAARADEADGSQYAIKIEGNRTRAEVMAEAATVSATRSTEPNGSRVTGPVKPTVDGKAVRAQAAEAVRLGQTNFGEAGRLIHDFIWDELADWYLEAYKILAPSGHADGALLAQVYDKVLRLLHPFAPFVTEELWQRLVQGAASDEPTPSIVIAPWPTASEARDTEAETRMEALMELVRGVRNARAEYKVDPGRWVPATLIAGGDADFFRRMATVIGELPGVRLRPITIVEADDGSGEEAVSVVAGGVTLHMPLSGLVDAAQERARMTRERDQTSGEIERAESLLSRPGFVEKARPDVVAKEREKLEALRDRLAKLDERLAALG